MPKLRVNKLYEDEAYEDLVRIPKKYREGAVRNSMVRLTTPSAEKTLLVLGVDDESPVIHMDMTTRDYFGVKPNEEVEFQIKYTPQLWAMLVWGCRHSNPALKVATLLGVIGLVLGFISLVLGLLPLFLIR
jgi:hypothetical protein